MLLWVMTMKPRYRVRLLACVLVLSGAGVLGSQSAAGKIGLFDQHGDVGGVKIPGSAAYDATAQSYTLRASGANMWFGADEFHFVWKKLAGDFILQAHVELLGKGVDPHRKVGLMVRSSLDPASPHVNVCRHGDGLTSLQFRRTAGADTEEVQSQVKGPDVLQLERKGDIYTMSVARFGDLYTTEQLTGVSLGADVYVGIFLCAHNADVTETAVLSNVRLIRPASDTFTPYRDYIGSLVEVLDVTTGLRRIVHQVEDSIQAPNWTPDGRRLIMNRNGRIYGFDLAARAISEIPTGIHDQEQQRPCAVVRREDARPERRLAVRRASRFPPAGERQPRSRPSGLRICTGGRRTASSWPSPDNATVSSMSTWSLREGAPKYGSPLRRAWTTAPSTRLTAGGSTSTPRGRAACRCGA